MEPVLSEAIEDFGFPVSLAFTGKATFYMSERMTGRLWEIGQGQNRLVKTFPVVPLIGHHETGLLGIALDPDFESNRYIYCYYTAGRSEKDFKNVVVRIKDDGSGEEMILDNIPAGMIHNGGILAFAPDKTLYIGTGVDDPVREQAQEKETLNGKVLRINCDGSIPTDNPFNNSPIYSYGHRNVFGLAFHPQTKKLYISEVGPDRDDEINIIEKGGNYGWPVVTGVSKDKRFIDPIKSYTPVITPVQNVFVGNDLYFGSYNEGTVHKLTLSGDNYERVEKDEVVFKHQPFTVIGVFYGPDEKFYLTTASSIMPFDPEAA
jgi:aldose sugar dehydrogenase